MVKKNPWIYVSTEKDILEKKKQNVMPIKYDSKVFW